jgi:hypothetical protein
MEELDEFAFLFGSTVGANDRLLGGVTLLQGDTLCILCHLELHV